MSESRHEILVHTCTVLIAYVSSKDSDLPVPTTNMQSHQIAHSKKGYVEMCGHLVELSALRIQMSKKNVLKLKFNSQEHS